MEEYIALKSSDFKLLIEYVEDMKPTFYKAEKAVEVQRIFRTAQPVKLTPAEQVINKPVKPPKV
jgi:hypothetical protein